MYLHKKGGNMVSLTSYKITNLIIPVSILGITYVLTIKNKRLSKKNKKLLKIMLISSIALYTTVNLRLINRILKLVFNKINNKKAYESMNVESKKFKLPRTKKIILASLIIATIIGVGLVSVKYFSPPVDVDDVDKLIQEIDRYPNGKLPPELQAKVDKWLSDSDERIKVMESNLEKDLENLKTIGKDFGFE